MPSERAIAVERSFGCRVARSANGCGAGDGRDARGDQHAVRGRAGAVEEAADRQQRLVAGDRRRSGPARRAARGSTRAGAVVQQPAHVDDVRARAPHAPHDGGRSASPPQVARPATVQPRGSRGGGEVARPASRPYCRRRRARTRARDRARAEIARAICAWRSSVATTRAYAPTGCPRRAASAAGRCSSARRRASGAARRRGGDRQLLLRAARVVRADLRHDPRGRPRTRGRWRGTSRRRTCRAATVESSHTSSPTRCAPAR